MHIDRQDAFWIGNVIGIVALVGTILVVAPLKERERKEHEDSKASAQTPPVPIVQHKVAPEQSQVFVLTRDLPAKAVLTRSAVKVHPLDKNKVPPDAVTDLAGAVGKTTWRSLVSGDILRRSDLAR